jgi:hypothetical protein
MDELSDIFYVHELIEALDRRLPQPERADAAVIARDVSALRARAVRRLAELEARAPRTGRGGATRRSSFAGATTADA